MLAAFEASFGANSMEEIVSASREDGENAVDTYGEALLANYTAHAAEVDAEIEGRLRDWTLARLPRVSAAILRMAVTEMRYSEENMDSIVINEAVEIAKKYGGEDDYQFINGILGAVARGRAAQRSADAKAQPEAADALDPEAEGASASQAERGTSDAPETQPPFEV